MVSFGMFSFIAESSQRRVAADALVQAATKKDRYASISPRLEDMAKKMPPKVHTFWQRAMKTSYPGIKLGADDWTTSCLGLFAYFRMLAKDAGGAKAGLALPSVSAHSIWREWERQDKRSLHAFLNKTLGTDNARYVGNCPPFVTGWAPRALADTWVLAHAMELIDVKARNNAEVPMVFAIDKSVRMPSGLAFFRHGLNPLCGFYSPMDSQGNVTKERLGEDVLSELFLYDMPFADTPEQAKQEADKGKPIISRALAAFRALFAKDTPTRAGPEQASFAPKKRKYRDGPVAGGDTSSVVSSPANDYLIAAPMLLAASVLTTASSEVSYAASTDSASPSSMDMGGSAGL